MPTKRYSQEQLEFLRHGYRKMRVPELTTAFNAAFGLDKSPGQIKCTLSNHKMTCGRPGGPEKGRLRLLTHDQMAFIKEHYGALGRKGVARALNDEFGTSFTCNQVTSFIKNHKLYSARTGQFIAGETPWNAGTKGLMKPNRTSFKKGCMSGAAQHNYKPIGSTRITRDGYLERKVTDDPDLVPSRRWVGEQRLVWEENNGPIPEGHVVVFFDGDKLNCDPGNLRCVTRGVLQYLNRTGLNKTRGEARKAAILVAETVTKAHALETSNRFAPGD